METKKTSSKSSQKTSYAKRPSNRGGNIEKKWKTICNVITYTIKVLHLLIQVIKDLILK